MTPPPHPNVQKISRKEHQQKEKAEYSSGVPFQPENECDDSKKTYNPSMDFINKLRNPHERPRKTLVDFCLIISMKFHRYLIMIDLLGLY